MAVCRARPRQPSLSVWNSEVPDMVAVVESGKRGLLSVVHSEIPSRELISWSSAVQAQWLWKCVWLGGHAKTARRKIPVPGWQGETCCRFVKCGECPDTGSRLPDQLVACECGGSAG